MFEDVLEEGFGIDADGFLRIDIDDVAKSIFQKRKANVILDGLQSRFGAPGAPVMYTVVIDEFKTIKFIRFFEYIYSSAVTPPDLQSLWLARPLMHKVSEI